MTRKRYARPVIKPGPKLAAIAASQVEPIRPVIKPISGFISADSIG